MAKSLFYGDGIAGKRVEALKKMARLAPGQLTIQWVIAPGLKKGLANLRRAIVAARGRKNYLRIVLWTGGPLPPRIALNRAGAYDIVSSNRQIAAAVIDLKENGPDISAE
jgi:hypothetical protein